MNCILSNCCNDKCDQSISKIFLCNFWRVFVITNLCGLGNSTFSIIVVDEDETASFILSFKVKTILECKCLVFVHNTDADFFSLTRIVLLYFFKLSELDVLKSVRMY